MAIKRAGNQSFCFFESSSVVSSSSCTAPPDSWPLGRALSISGTANPEQGHELLLEKLFLEELFLGKVFLRILFLGKSLLGEGAILEQSKESKRAELFAEAVSILAPRSLPSTSLPPTFLPPSQMSPRAISSERSGHSFLLQLGSAILLCALCSDSLCCNLLRSNFLRIAALVKLFLVFFYIAEKQKRIESCRFT